MRHAIYKGALHFRATEEQREAIKKLVLRFLPNRRANSHTQTAYHIKHLVQMWFDFEMTIDDVDRVMVELGYANNVGCHYKVMTSEYNSFVMASEWVGHKRQIEKLNIDFCNYDLSDIEREAVSKAIDDVIKVGASQNDKCLKFDHFTRYLEIKTGISNIPIWVVDQLTKEKKISRSNANPEMNAEPMLKLPKAFVNMVIQDARYKR